MFPPYGEYQQKTARQIPVFLLERWANAHEKERETDEIDYDHFVSLLAQYQREEITQVAQIVEQKLEALLAAVTR